MEDILYLIGAFVLLIVSAFAVIFITFLIFTPLSSKSCQDSWRDFEYRYGIWEGCQIKVDGKWINTTNYYINNQQK